MKYFLERKNYKINIIKFLLFIICFFYIAFNLIYYRDLEPNELNTLYFVDILIIIILLSLYSQPRNLVRFDYVFVILFPFYFKISFLLYYEFDVSIFTIAEIKIRESYNLCNISWLLTIILVVFRPDIIGIEKYKNILTDFYSNKVENGSFLVPALLCFIISAFFISKIIPYIGMDVSKLSRLELTEIIGHSGWSLKYIVIAYFWVVIFHFAFAKKVSLINLIMLLFPVFLYAYYQFFLGGRREIILMIFFMLYLFIIKNGKVQYNYIFFIVFLMAGFISLGIYRDYDSENAVKVAVDALGEFIFPISTLNVHYANENTNILLGSTYLYTFTNFIPSSLLPIKPLPLAVQFANMVAEPTQEYILGYAITPITEAYLNFGVFTPLIFPLVIVLFCMFCEIVSQRLALLQLVLMSQVLNFQRSDIPSLIFETVLLLVCFYVHIFLLRVRVKI